jgi:putative ABC transport system substrate-binding protein
MQRREFITLVGGAAAWPLAARAQQPALALVGLLTGATLDDRSISAVRQGLIDTGYIEGRNVAIKYRSADGRFERLPALAAGLVSDHAAVIVTTNPSSALAAKAATATIPIVFATGADPVDLGLVSSLNRPGGNATGVTFLVTTLGGKRLELLRELAPTTTVIGFLINPSNPTSESQTKDAQAAALALGIELLVMNAETESDIDTSFARLPQRRVDAVIIGADQFFLTRRDQLVALAARHAMPAIYYVREFVTAGGLMSYGTSITDAFRLAGAYAGRILKGEKPSDLPVQQTAKFEFVINVKTAKALGLAVPLTMQVAADEVLE